MSHLGRILFAPVLLVAAAAACYPGGPDVAGELDLVATWHDTNADFTANHTYAMPDTVVDLSVIGGGMSSLNHVHDDTLLATIAAQMQAAGYTRVDSTGADVLVLVGGVSVDHTDVWYPVYPPGGWWGWWGGYPCPTCVPIYPWYPVATQYTIGTIVISMVNPPATADNKIPAVWGAAINGLVTGSDASIDARIQTLVTQAFNQSPYLKVQ
jgi:hypothetical protein